jgi:hypothetical protein
MDARLVREGETSLMSCDGVQCSGPRGKQAKSYPLSDFIAFSPLPSFLALLSLSLPSLPIHSYFKIISIRTSYLPILVSPILSRPLKSAFAASFCYLPRHHHHIRYSSEQPTRLSSELLPWSLDTPHIQLLPHPHAVSPIL